MTEQQASNRIIQWIASYEESRRLIQQRIVLLNRQISSAQSGQKPLERRRYLLYRQLWDLERTIESLREYAGLQPLQARRTTWSGGGQ